MSRAKLFVQALPAGEEFLGEGGNINEIGWGGGAVVTVGTVMISVFAKVIQQRLSPAGGLVFCVADDRIRC